MIQLKINQLNELTSNLLLVTYVFLEIESERERE